MSDRISDERIAELLDGRVPAEERAELLSRLAAEGDDFDVFAEAGGVLRELEEAEAVPTPAPAAKEAVGADGAAPAGRLDPPSMRQPSRWGRRPARWLVAVVPVLVLAILVTVLWPRGAGRNPSVPAAQLARAELPAGWLDSARPWPVTRGGNAPVEDLGRAAQVGALHTDLALAIAARNDTATTWLVARINYLLSDEPGGNDAVPIYREIGERAGAPPAELQPLLDGAGEQVTMYMDAKRVRLGAWGEAARIAAAGRDSAFFASSAARSAFGRAARDEDLPPEAREAARRIRDAEPGAWDVLADNADALLRAIAS